MPDVSSYLPHWMFPGDDRPPEEIDDEIAEELRFHLDMLAEQGEREGVTSEEARRQAEERFGDFDRILRRCRLEKQGDAPMLKRVQAGLILLLAAGVAAIGWQQWALSSNLASLHEGLRGNLEALQRDVALLAGPTETPVGPSNDPDERELMIQVVKPDGQPIANARLVLETTNASENGIDYFEATADETGRYLTRLSDDGFRISRVTAYAPGYALSSKTLNRPFGGRASVELKLQEGRSTRFRFVLSGGDAEDEALVGGLVFPRLGWLAAVVTPIEIDANGTIETDWFSVGDTAQFLVEIPGRSLVSRSTVVRSDLEGPIRVEVTQQGLFGGGGQF